MVRAAKLSAMSAPDDTLPADSWPPDLVVLIPVYNHGSTVGAVVAAARRAGAAVLVVDDGSSDDSAAAASAAGAELLTLASNQGKGAALAYGLAAAHARGFTRALACDADGQHPPEAVLELMRVGHAEPQALWLGVRRMAGAPRASRVGRWWCNVGTWFACGLWPRDNQTGLRIYPLPVMNALPIRARRYAYEVESTIRAVWAGVPLRTCEVPVLYPVDRISHFQGWRDSLRGVATCLRLMVTLPWARRSRQATPS